jgi:D-alanine--poly(phosphoribitol) ligase subunit 1
MKFDFRKREFVGSDGGSKIAVVGRGRSLTWSELKSQVTSLVGELRQLKVPAGHPVIIRGEKEAEFVVSILACMICELPYVPLDRVFPVDRVSKIQNILGSQVLLQCGAREDLSFSIQVSVADLKVSASAVSLNGQVSADPLVYVIFTSGSTGEPKGVEITRTNVLDFLNWILSEDFSFSDKDVFINQCSFSFDVSFFDLLASLQNGATLILNAPDQIKNADEFTTRIGPLKPTVWVSTPSFLSLALLNREFKSEVLPDLKKFYLAGETLHHSLVKRTHAKFARGKVFNAYGPTEATVIVTLIEVSAELMEKYPAAMPIGRVKSTNQIVLENSFEQDGNQVGEIVIVGENVARGYFGRPDLTEQKFTKVNGRSAYRTGDHGYYKDGLLFFIGRIDNQIKLHGFRIEIDEIDSHIMSLPGVELSVTVPLIRDGDVKKLVAFVKLKAAKPDEVFVSEVRAHLEKRVPAYMIPGAFKIVEDFPYGASHKVDKKKLLALL